MHCMTDADIAAITLGAVAATISLIIAFHDIYRAYFIKLQIRCVIAEVHALEFYGGRSFVMFRIALINEASIGRVVYEIKIGVNPGKDIEQIVGTLNKELSIRTFDFGEMYTPDHWFCAVPQKDLFNKPLNIPAHSSFTCQMPFIVASVPLGATNVDVTLMSKGVKGNQLAKSTHSVQIKRI